MAAVQLTIIQPSAPETIFSGAAAGNVMFAGQISGALPEALAGVTLFYRWYSSLFGAEKDRYSMNDTCPIRRNHLSQTLRSARISSR
jgi:hypothetical protein